MERSSYREVTTSEKSFQVDRTTDQNQTLPARGGKSQCDTLMDSKAFNLLLAEDILDTFNRELEDIKHKILKTAVRCSILEVDLATQFNPYYNEVLRNAQEACKHCNTVIQSQKTTTQEATIKQRYFSSEKINVSGDTAFSCTKVGDTTDEQMTGIETNSASAETA
ncbi:uncharacterized protein LOC112564890 [Pomacea canaliculata]|uniref:uncharacterized protein LOC112564890 n=1 Tax=Pomacea canaliculata TaxID=400727 RepID=UPI000D72A636|nr:uncharacterized protein LOC112564890 [Pomacea canaliculata]XP_025095784.1 uncharacterized protein LOC112564890 [Pomacea canaliculata]